MRACCNKKEDNFITYHQSREKTIDRVRDWEKLNPEKRKEYTIKYYKTEKGHRKRLAQQKRYREKKKLKDTIIKLQQRITVLEKVITTNKFGLVSPSIKEYEVQILKSRTKKAIEYIGQELLTYDNESDEHNVGIKLIEILKGSDK